MRQTVHSHDFSAHEYRLGKSHGSTEHIMDIVGHRLFRDEGHGFGNGLAAGAEHGLSGGGIFNDVELVALRGGVERLSGQKLVAAEDSYVLLVVHIAAFKVEGWQIGSQSFLFLITGHFYGLGA